MEFLWWGPGPWEKTDGSFSDPAENILHSGDYIVAANGSAVTRKEELVSEVGASAGEPVVLKVERDGNLTELLVQPVLDKKESTSSASGSGTTPRASEH